MQFTVLLFGPAATTANADRVVVEASEAETHGGVKARDVLAALAAAHPSLGPIVSAGRLARNHDFAGPDEIVRPGDELALVALVSGG